ncbi:Ribosomal RNA processing protein 1 B [Chytridiales sp. JEL 0842]|nr:Ribosomal RNA processing protein 1 B [Chytridiales sp. JEL 0842]
MTTGFGKNLANSDRKVRDQAVASLVQWLQSKSDITDLEMLKLWKGLFYCFWMSDKWVIQQHLAEKLAGVALELEVAVGLKYIQAFWSIMIREWHGIDRLRLDKFYFLLRKFHGATFKLLDSSEWDADIWETVESFLTNGPLHLTSHQVADGLRYHTVDVLLEEIQSSVGFASIPSTMLLKVFGPFLNILSVSTNKIWVSRIKDLFIAVKDLAANAEASEETKQNVALLGKQLFKTAALKETLQKNRETIYELYEMYNSTVPVDVADVIEDEKPVVENEESEESTPEEPVEEKPKAGKGKKRALKAETSDSLSVPKKSVKKRKSEQPQAENETTETPSSSGASSSPKKNVTFGSKKQNKIKTFDKTKPLGNFQIPDGQPTKPAIKLTPEKSLTVVEKPKAGVWAIKRRK